MKLSRPDAHAQDLVAASFQPALCGPLLLLALPLVLLSACAPARDLLPLLQQGLAPRAQGLTPAPEATIAQLAHAAPGCLDDGCHRSLLPQATAYLHEPFAQGKCDQCHPQDWRQYPHRAPHVASTEDIEVCLPCHRPAKLGTSHPVGPGITDPRTGGMLTCTSTCHDPHSSANPYLLRYPKGEALCLTCHTELSP